MAVEEPNGRILLLIARTSNREQLALSLSRRYEVISESDGSLTGALEDCDLCLLDDSSVGRYRADLMDSKETVAPEFLPYLLVMTNTSSAGFSDAPLELVDEVVQTPVREAELHARVAVLLRARGYSLELSRQNDRLEQFASVVSHDLRNPLNVAQGRLRMVRSECDSEHLEPVVRAQDRMQALIDDVLSLARGGTAVTETEVVALRAVVQRAWQNVETARATLDIATERSIRADRSRLQQVLENLVRNAVEHGGTDVTISVGDLPDGFYVADDGPGVPETDRAEAFEAGYTTSEDGTGFGLGIVTEIVEAHGWAVGLTESSGGGARFEITGVDFAGS